MVKQQAQEFTAQNTTAMDSRKLDNVLSHVENTDGIALGKSEAAVDAAAAGQATTGYETLTLWQTAKKFKVAAIVCFLAAFSACTDGFQIGINASIIANEGFVRQFATKHEADGTEYLASPILSAWGSIMSVGQIVGMTASPFVSGRFGRKAAMYAYWFVLAMSVMTESLSRDWSAWLVAKLLAGVGVGSMQSTLPTYISEVAPVRIRGALLMCYSLWFSLGVFVAQIALNAMNASRPLDWLLPIYCQWGQIGLMIVVYLFLPESPVWCVERGRLDRAQKELRRINYGVADYDAAQQLQVLALAVDHERAVAEELRQTRWYAIFRGTNGLRTVIALWTNMTQQFVGLTLFSVYGTYFFQQAGIKDPFQVTVITSSMNIAATIALILTGDRIGRRSIACYAATLSWLACLIVGILGVVPRSNAINDVFVFFVCLWNIGTTAIGAAGWSFIGEISSQRLRHYTAGFGAALTCVAGIVMGVLVPYMVNTNQWNWGLKTAFFYVGLCLPFVIGIWFLIPETTGRTAAELDELFERKIKPWNFRKTETATQRLVNAEKKAAE